MKALCVKQPWASLIATEAKTIETRTWRTNYRGPLLIVASKTFSRDVELDLVLRAEELTEIYGKVGDKLPLGKAIATCELIDCRPMTINDEEDALCRVYDGAMAWILSDIKRIQPYSVKGRLGLFDVAVWSL